MSKKRKNKREGQKRPSQPSQRRGRKQNAPKTARDRIRTERTLIEDPWDGRKVEATRTVDTIAMLYRRGQIGGRQHRAAEAYREASEICGGSIPCTLDQSRVGGTAGPSSPTEAQLRAAGVLSDAARVLGLLDAKVVSLIAVEGYSIEETAAHIFGVAPGGKAKRADAEHVGRRLRIALEALADTWWPPRHARPVGIRAATQG